MKSDMHFRKMVWEQTTGLQQPFVSLYQTINAGGYIREKKIYNCIIDCGDTIELVSLKSTSLQ